jgi:hypothetical protein
MKDFFQLRKDLLVAEGKEDDNYESWEDGEGKEDDNYESWEDGYERRVVKTHLKRHKEQGDDWRIKGKDRDEVTIKLYKNKPDFAEFKKQMKRVAGHEFG